MEVPIKLNPNKLKEINLRFEISFVIKQIDLTINVSYEYEKTNIIEYTIAYVTIQQYLRMRKTFTSGVRFQKDFYK